MKVVVLSGSPKGDNSVTSQYVKYIQKKFPQHEYQSFSISQKIKQIENTAGEFEKLLQEIENADAVIWAFPLYYMLVPAQYKRFIELVFERNATMAFKNKYAAVITTSIHFYDHTAHNYLQAVCDDLGMNYWDSFSAEMYDLTKESEQHRLNLFAENFFRAIQNKTATIKTYPRLPEASSPYTPTANENRVSPGGKKIVLLADCRDGGSNLGKMISRFQQTFTEPIPIFFLQNLDIKGGCLGCIRCAYDNTCVYQDEFKEFVLKQLASADILIFAGSIKDRYLSSDWKQFFDRTFFNNHVPLFKNKQFAYLISGPLSYLPNLRQILEGYTELQHSNLAGIVSDEHPSEEIDSALQSLSQRLMSLSSQNYTKPATYLYLGGKKIFRDELWSDMRFPFVADYKYHSKNGYFDFPYKRKSWLVNSILAFLSNIPAFRKEIYSNRMAQEMLKPFAKVVN